MVSPRIATERTSALRRWAHSIPAAPVKAGVKVPSQLGHLGQPRPAPLAITLPPSRMVT